MLLPWVSRGRGDFLLTRDEVNARPRGRRTGPTLPHPVARRALGPSNGSCSFSGGPGITPSCNC